MISDVALTDRFTYDGEKCLDLYRNLDPSDSQALNDFVCYLKRHVVAMVRKQYLKRVRRDLCEDLVQSALIELWKVAQDKKIPDQSAAVFHSFINTIIKRRNAKTFSEVYDDSPKKMDPAEYISEGSSRLPYGDEEEYRLFRTDLPETIKNKVLEQKWSEEERPAVVYILNEVLFYHQEPVEPWLKREFKIPAPKDLIERVMIWVRASLYEIRPDLQYRTNAARQDILNEGLEECLND